MKRHPLLFIFLLMAALAGGLHAAKRKSPKAPVPAQPAADRAAPPEEAPAGSGAPAEEPAASADSDASAPAKPAASAADRSAGGTASQDLDVTIKGEAKDEVPVLKTPPPLEAAFREMVPLAREGQTEKILEEPVQHLSFEAQTRLLNMDSRQVVSAASIKIPSPPFFKMEIPSVLANGKGAAPKWSFKVVDQENREIHKTEGENWPKNFMIWDGMENGAPKIQSGVAYTPIIEVAGAKGKTERYYGDPVSMSIFSYVVDGLANVEMNNNRLFVKGSADFKPEMLPALEAVADALRPRVGGPIRIVVNELPKDHALAEKRTAALKAYFQNALHLGADDIAASIQAPDSRGPVSVIMAMDRP